MNHSLPFLLFYRASVFGTYIEYGGDKKVSTHSRLGAKIAVGVPMGVTLKIRLVYSSLSLPVDDATFQFLIPC